MSSWRSAKPTIPPALVVDVPRVDQNHLQELRTTDTATVSDQVGPLYCLDPGIRALHYEGLPLLGQALTVKAVPGDNRAIIAALNFVEDGDVLVVDWRGYVGACGSGSKVLAIPRHRGLAGVVVDGAWRDVAEIAALGVPVFGRSQSVVSPAKENLGEINVPIACGGVVVHPGDVVFGDASGVVVVPRLHVSAVADAVATDHGAQQHDSFENLRARAEVRQRDYVAAFDAAGGKPRKFA